ncbi:atrial natriuretic peptide receptor 1-like [Antedon mediterranea]|uniref:atrial natriuretic peptide receptor 1-like n=1 Tax=Antedon mediterranea TaxID=105859 RepID=UPI003AF5B30C
MAQIRTFVCQALLTLIVVQRGYGWHNLGDSTFHCWSLDAGSEDKDNVFDCRAKGLSFAWVGDVPSTVVAEETFYVNYSLSATDEFFEWAIDTNSDYALLHGRILNKNSVAEAKDFCYNTTCDDRDTSYDENNCCLHHINVHSCPQSVIGNGICGPWIPPNGTIFTHTPTVYGNLATAMWSTEVALVTTGLTSIIAHIRIGNIQAALHSVLTVEEAVVCGDAFCDTERDEDCSVCPADCGSCPLSTGEIAAIIASIFTIVVLLALIYLYFYWKQQKMLWDESWIINYDEIKPDNGAARGLMGSMVSMLLSAENLTDISSGHTGLASQMQNKQVFAELGLYNGQTLAVKRIAKTVFQLTKAIRKEVKSVRDVQHVNLCKFIGACIEVPNVSILTEYCPKGSVQDVLLNEDIPLNWGFRFSFCTDIARAMTYLHQNKIYHGRLTSSNCVVDDRWVVKVTDYGMPLTRQVEDQEFDRTYKDQVARVYLPPEVINGHGIVQSPTTDVYSYAVILVEIASRSEPYESEDLEKINGVWRPELPDLADIPRSNNNDEHCPCPKEYIELITNCWQDSALARPTFSHIKQTLYTINPSKLSPVDMMMQLMEKYSKHLEVLVNERTQDLIHEKQKTDRLLYSMLPKSVADELKRGKSATAESFEGCTIFFSDIVGFTKLSSSSSPYEIIALLNKLYVTFDSIIDNYDVYKVETIGDAYMVVSGLPNRNGDKHAGEIASMALDLVRVCNTFVIPHKPDTKLLIRAGIHSGPVVAGVVGLKMPRYCLFGDTVNTASRMESTGEALRIQASDNCKKVLDKIGGYSVEERGEMQVKGKGMMRTYWVMGRVRIPSHSLRHSHHSIATTGGSSSGLTSTNIIMDEEDNRTKKLSLEERSEDGSFRRFSLPGSIEEKDGLEMSEKLLLINESSF